MHFVFGGAFTGKRKWVKQHYASESVKWHYLYEDPVLPVLEFEESYIVLEGFEHYVKELIHSELESPHLVVKKLIQKWRDSGVWEKLIVIGTEVGKGIVPLDPTERQWRDECGYSYQYLAAHARKVDHIWYGIANRLKEEIQ